MILAHKIQLDPTVEQTIALARAAGCARFTWNWALAEWDRQYKAGEKPTANKLKLLWNQIKHEEFPWIGESPKDANQQPFANLNTAFQRFFKKKAGRPGFKKKGVHDSFYVSNDKFRLDGQYVKLPVIDWIKMTEELRFDGRITAATVSRTADKWFIAIQVEMEDVIEPRIADGVIGIDLGVKTALVTSDGQTFEAPKPLKARLGKLRRLQRQHSRKQKGSQNRKKSQIRIARQHLKIRNVRQDWIHKITTTLCRENKAIYLEDLNVKGMLRNHCLARAISDIGFGEIRRQLEYKSKVYETTVGIIDRWLPSSKTCYHCGHVKDVLALSERTFICDHCGFSLDRDLNAARNILAAGLAASACGPESSGTRCKSNTKLCGVEAGTKPRAHSHVLTN
jgi:putative transposase